MTSIFSEIIAGERPAHVLCRGGRTIVFLSLEGHPLVVPLAHVERLDELDDETGREMFQMAKQVARALREATQCEGINLVLSDGAAAGQDVFHLHLHVKPRWRGDDVRLEWNTDTVEDNTRAALAADLRKHLTENLTEA